MATHQKEERSKKKTMKILTKLLSIGAISLTITTGVAQTVTFEVIDTKQEVCFDNNGMVIPCLGPAAPLYGQDAQYNGTQPSFQDNGNGTITDNNTGLVWQKGYQTNNIQYAAAFTYCNNLTTGGITNWRVPTIKELFSLADFRGEIIGGNANLSTPYIDTTYFDFSYPNQVYAGQYWSSTLYTMGGAQANNVEVAFGFNFADGHIKGYETGFYFGGGPGVSTNGNFCRCVSGTENVYGVNNFQDNGNGTISDNATGLMWTQTNGSNLDWEDALSYCENLTTGGHNNWRLPNIKELQGITDYDRTQWPALDTTVFNMTNWDTWYWSSTTHGDKKNYAAYMCFGKAYSKDSTAATVYYDWHGAGAQRSDPKSGIWSDYISASVNATDSVRIDNDCFCVRNDVSTGINLLEKNNINIKIYPNPVKNEMIITSDEELQYIKIYNIQGILILQTRVSGLTTRINTSSLIPGVYVVEYTDQNEITSSNKIVVKR